MSESGCRAKVVVAGEKCRCYLVFVLCATSGGVGVP